MNQDRQSGVTILNRLRIRHSRLDTGAADLRRCGALAAADLRPASLSPAVILVIRKLRDPLPGSLKFRGSESQLPVAWQQATCAAIEELARRAYRPALGVVPAAAEAVIFLDRAELLSCLASDWCAGRLTAHWWWSCLFQLTDELPVNEWLKAPEYVPMALARLSDAGKAGTFLTQLTDEQADLILRAILHTFGLAEIQAILEATLWKAASMSSRAFAAPRKAPSAVMPLTEPSRVFAGWPAGNDAALSEGSMAQHLLCHLGVMLARRPAAIRSAAFARGLEAWLQTRLDEAEHLPEAEANAEIERLPSQPSPDLNDRKRTRRRPVESLNPEMQQSSTIRGEEGKEKPSRNYADPRMLKKVHALEPSPDAQAAVAKRGRLSIHANNSERTESQDSPVNVEALTSETTADQETQESDLNHQKIIPDETTFFTQPDSIIEIETGLGGLFYLVNLALFLDLYGDFTMPMRPALGLAIWDYLALVGEAFCGEPIKDDRVWALLATLAERRADTPPGQDFEPPDAWRIPAEWLRPFENREVSYEQTADHRLRILHPGGFSIVDVPLIAGRDPHEQLAQETQAYDCVGKFKLRRLASRQVAEVRSPLERWLGWLMAYQRARLVAALGLGDAGQLVDRLLRHPARISVTPVRLEVFFDLNQLPIEIRLAGLDRNPGWIPAAGRFIKFHFD